MSARSVQPDALWCIPLNTATSGFVWRRRRSQAISHLVLERADELRIAEGRMTEDTIKLDQHRGMAAQKATELRRLLSEVEANEKQLRERQKALEDQLLATPALTWEDAADKACYLLSLFASSQAAQDPRRQLLISRVIEDFVRLSPSRKETDVPT